MLLLEGDIATFINQVSFSGVTRNIRRTVGNFTKHNKRLWNNLHSINNDFA